MDFIRDEETASGVVDEAIRRVVATMEKRSLEKAIDRSRRRSYVLILNAFLVHADTSASTILTKTN